jgi:hypothetical protein
MGLRSADFGLQLVLAQKLRWSCWISQFAALTQTLLKPKSDHGECPFHSECSFLASPRSIASSRNMGAGTSRNARHVTIAKTSDANSAEVTHASSAVSSAETAHVTYPAAAAPVSAASACLCITC